MTTLVARVLPVVAATAVSALGATLSVRAAGVDALRPLWQARRPLIYAVWHGRILIVPWLNARLRRSEGARRVRVLASRSRDGQLMADFARRFGLDVVRGSSSRGGVEALRELARAIRAGEDVAVVPDGPRGPARRLHSWDRFMVPVPFARCAVVFGGALEVKRHDEREDARARVEQALEDATDAADALVGARR